MSRSIQLPPPRSPGTSMPAPSPSPAAARPAQAGPVDAFAAPLKPTFSGKDVQRPKVAVQLEQVGEGFAQPTDIQFAPHQPELMLVAEKTGKLKWRSLADSASGTLLTIQVSTQSEQGLLGLAFSPEFARDGRFFLSYTVSQNGQVNSRIQEFTVPPGADLKTAQPTPGRIILEVPQPPFPNHKGGQIAFGQDGYLYIGFGDGGSAGDPQKNAQNPQSLLGKMLRIDVNTAPGGKPYAIPSDNPFAGSRTTRQEIFALGLRNPWRFSFDPQGKLIAADVGQNAREEIDLVESGKNYGWSWREGTLPHDAGTAPGGLVEPIYEYDRDDGKSVTGGYVSLSPELPALSGKYVFGDFISGRIWALDPKSPQAGVQALGQFPVSISTFGRDNPGRVYVADFTGKIFRVAPQ